MSAGTKTERADALIAALLTEPTHALAAVRAGVSEATAQRWLRKPGFKKRYRAARRMVLESAVGRLQRAATDAVDTLSRNLNCGTPSVEVRAALAVLEQSTKALELYDLTERLEAIETAMAEQSANGEHS